MRAFKVSKTTAEQLNRKTLKEIEEKGEVKIKITKDNEIEVTSPEENGGKEWAAELVLKALVYGFETKHAFKLFSEEYFIETIDLENAFRRKAKNIERAKARIIGERGSARKKLEELSDTNIRVSNNTNNVSIIGRYEDLQNAKEAILRLLEGAPHESVYRFLESKIERGL